MTKRLLTVYFRAVMHSPDPSSLIRELARISDGAVILDFSPPGPCQLCTLFFRKMFAHYNKSTHALRMFTLKQMDEMFSENGFIVRRISDRFVLPVFLRRVLANHFDAFKRVYAERFQPEYGYWRPVIRTVIDKFLKCGDLREGFARVRCPDGSKERRRDRVFDLLLREEKIDEEAVRSMRG